MLGKIMLNFIKPLGYHFLATMLRGLCVNLREFPHKSSVQIWRKQATADKLGICSA